MGYRLKEKKLKDAEGLRNYGIWKLGQQEMSRKALKLKMNEWALDKDDVEPILDDFEERGWINDQRCAEMYVRMYRDSRRYGPVKIRGKLREKGIDDRLIAQVLDERDPAWFDLARKAREAKFSDLPADRKEKEKQSRYLLLKGFSFDHVGGAFKKSDDEMYE